MILLIFFLLGVLLVLIGFVMLGGMLATGTGKLRFPAMAVLVGVVCIMLSVKLCTGQ